MPTLTLTEDKTYTSSRLTKGTISLDEIQTLLLAWRSGEPSLDFAERIQQMSILTKHTAQRVRDVIDLFRYWFLTPDETPARDLRAFVDAGGERRVLSELVFLYKARGEKVLYDYTCKRYWPAANEGALYLPLDDVESFLQEAQEKGFVAQNWALSTRGRLASGIRTALFEAGLIQENRGGNREFASYQPSDFLVAYLVHNLHFQGLSDGQIANHPDWSLFGLAREGTLRRLDALDRSAGLLVQWAGSVVSITWKHSTMDEVIHALVA